MKVCTWRTEANMVPSPGVFCLLDWETDNASAKQIEENMVRKSRTVSCHRIKVRKCSKKADNI